jgi:hypothetical protein
VVIGQEMPVKLAEMIPVVEGWLRVAEQEGMPIQFETHRNCITNDLFTTVQLLDAVPAMRLAADLSHYVVDREMPCPPPAALQALITKVLERSDSFQGRVAARGQIQIPLGFPQSAKWVELFRRWWREGFTAWHARHRTDDAALVFLCELGPPDYAITAADGRELSDRWEEALTLARWARELWCEVSARIRTRGYFFSVTQTRSIGFLPMFRDWCPTLISIVGIHPTSPSGEGWGYGRSGSVYVFAAH